MRHFPNVTLREIDTFRFCDRADPLREETERVAFIIENLRFTEIDGMKSVTFDLLVRMDNTVEDALLKAAKDPGYYCSTCGERLYFSDERKYYCAKCAPEPPSQK